MASEEQTPHPLIRLLRYAEGYRGRIIAATIVTIMNKIADLAPPALIGVAIDIVVNQEQSLFAELGITGLMNQLWVLAGVTVVVWGAESFFQYVYQRMWRNLAQTIEHDMRVEAYDHVQHLEISYFEDRSTGGLMSVLNDDINQLERFLDVGAAQLIQVATTVIVIGGLFVITAPQAAWMAIIPIPIIIYGSVRFQKLIGPKYAAVREQVGLLNGILSNNLSGIATIKSFTAEEHEVERIREESDEYREANKDAIKLSAAFVPIIRMVIASGFIAIMVAGGQMVFNGQLEVAVYSVLIFMTQRLLWPLTRLGETFDLYQRAMASTDRILNLMDTEAQLDDGEISLPVEQINGAIAFEDVIFRYERGEPVIEGLTFDVNPGETIGIVGATGAGKSTLVKLLLRFYDVSEGRITLDGHDLRDLELTDLRSAIGFVSQDVYLFHGTVKENIVYGSFQADMERVIEAAKLAEAHEFIMGMPDEYDTVVGERGQKLSGGQRQRLSIARAILKNPPILVLDEATSAVDNETEAAIQRSLEHITQDRTTIMIAHRLSTVRDADRIFVLEEGQVREKGRHEELLDRDGIYAALWKVQTGEKAAAFGD